MTEPVSRESAPSRLRHAGLFAGFSALALALALGFAIQSPSDAEAPAIAEAVPPKLIGAMPATLADLVERVAPAVVSVKAERKTDATAFNQFGPEQIPEQFRFFFFGPDGENPNMRRFGMPAPQPIVSEGSGFIIDADGYVVTNNHVVAGAEKFTVTLSDGRERTAKLVGADKATDIALLKLDDGGPYPVVAFADDAKVRVGDWVVAVGNPFGLGGTVTAGIVSARGRDVGDGPYTDFLQIDAAINRGNSGGPAFDLSGNVVGMNTLIFSPSGGSVGIGFAIPASTIQSVVVDLRAHGSVARGWLGIQIQTLDADLAASVGLDSPKGAMVAKVTDGSPAAAAGFKRGDVVLAVDGAEVASSRELAQKVAALAPGKTATFKVWRAGSETTIEAAVGRMPQSDQVAAAEAAPSDSAQAAAAALGLNLAPVDEETKRRLNLPEDVSGVVILAVAPGSEAAAKGLQPGDVILAANNQGVASPDDVKQAVLDAKGAGRDALLLLVQNGGNTRFVALKLKAA